MGGFDQAYHDESKLNDELKKKVQELEMKKESYERAFASLGLSPRKVFKDLGLELPSVSSNEKKDEEA